MISPEVWQGLYGCWHDVLGRVVCVYFEGLTPGSVATDSDDIEEMLMLLPRSQKKVEKPPAQAGRVLNASASIFSPSVSVLAAHGVRLNCHDTNILPNVQTVWKQNNFNFGTNQITHVL